MQASDPIGIFDSGVGGLTVAHAVTRLLPNENIVYFGDTAHLPYGDKSADTLKTYSLRICEILLQHRCKMILIACNSAASAAHEDIQKFVGDQALVVSVIDPIIDEIHLHYPRQCIGLIGTQRTISSNVYKKRLDALQCGIELRSVATPLLVPMIEEGFIDNEITEHVIHQYLNNPLLNGIQALILGCTHYPLIKNRIADYYESKVSLIDSCDAVAHSVEKKLAALNLLNSGQKTSSRKFYVSDYTEFFERSAHLFFGNAVTLELHKYD